MASATRSRKECQPIYKLLSYLIREWIASAAVHPLDGNTYASPAFVPSSGAPTPIVCAIYEPCSNGIEMHVVQLLFNFIATVDIEGVIFRQPESTVVLECLSILGCIFTVPFPNPQAALTFPLVHECTQLPGLRKPQDDVNMVWHYHEADAFALAFFQSVSQHTEENPSDVIVNK